MLNSHGISSQAASPAIMNAILLSPAVRRFIIVSYHFDQVMDSDVTLRNAIGHVLLTSEHRIVLVEPET